MKKLFIFGDVHSFYDEWIKALDESGFDISNPDHVLVSLGDICDRGPKSTEVLRRINSLPENRKICIIGNHELLMESMISRGRSESVDITNGSLKTVENLTGITGHPSVAISEMKMNTLWSNYKKNWRWYFEVGDFIFVHGWIPCAVYDKWGYHLTDRYDPNWCDANSRKWDDATWVNGMAMWDEGIREPGKTIFCGHWHTSWGHSHLHDYGVEFVKKVETFHFSEKYGRTYPFAEYGPFVDEGIVALDSCVVVSHRVNVYVVEVDDRVWEEATM